MTTIELLKRTKAAWPALSAAGEEEKVLEKLGVKVWRVEGRQNAF